jgi:hypothetical protein
MAVIIKQRLSLAVWTHASGIVVDGVSVVLFVRHEVVLMCGFAELQVAMMSIYAQSSELRS